MRTSHPRCFGPFRLSLTEQSLYEGTRRVRLGSRAFEILVALTDQPGELVSKDDILAKVWPNLHVGDGALRVHLVALRKALGVTASGQGYIANVASRGYRFVQPVSVQENPVTLPVAELSPTKETSPPWIYNLPMPFARVVGRDQATEAIIGLLPQYRLVTIVGTGGIGKTTVAIAVADRLLSSYADGVYFVDFASIAHDGLVPASIALSLGLSNLSEDPTAGLLAALRQKRLLLILDSCERVVDAAALLVERILQAAPNVHILATSREPLRAQGERVQRLPPLGTPPATTGLTAEQARAYPAVQLFTERASAHQDDFALNDANAPVVADICRRLDGIALAIELVAGNVATFDLHSLATMLHDRFHVLSRGRRTAIPRHRTMRAVIDWSFDTISELERRVLRPLAVFDGLFELDAAQAVAADADATPEQVIDGVAILVDKSLLTAEVNEEAGRYRLLDTMRAYALERLVLSGEQNVVAHRHARHYLAVFVRANATLTPRNTRDWLPQYSRHLGNVRAALDWAFSEAGCTLIGISLSAESLPLLFELSLAEECRRRAAQALSALASNPSADRRLEMRLRATLAAGLTYTPGPIPETAMTWRIVLQIATELDETTFKLRALWGLWTACAYGGAPREALAYAETFSRMIPAQDTASRLLGDRIIGVSQHYVGEQQAARDRIEQMLIQYDQAEHNNYPLGFQINHGLMARATLARILWVQGAPDQGLRVLRQSLEGARAQNHGISICYVISEAAIPLFFMAGDMAAAENELAVLEHLADQHGLAIWQAEVRCVKLAIDAAKGIAVPIQLFGAAASQLRATGYTAHSTWLSGVMAEASGTQGTVGAKIALVDSALKDCERTGELWGVAELLRVKAVLMTQERSAAAEQAAQDILRQAMELADRQQALSWELRAAVSLARMRLRKNQRFEAEALLEPILRRFDEGFETADLVAANQLLQAANG